MALRADQFNQIAGTIAAGGSVSQVVDLEGWNVSGLMIVPNGTQTLTAGSIQFRVSVDNVTFYPLQDATNVRVALPFATAGIAYSEAAVRVVSPYRYVRVETTAAQSTGARVVFPVKLY